MTELIWEDKYDPQGRRVAPLRVRLPFQTVETVNESAQERQRSLQLFSSGRAADWRNRLVWGDKKYVLPALLDEFTEQIDLIYIDPPFGTGQDFSLPVRYDGNKFTKEPSMLEVKAYRDTWKRGVDSYLQWFHEAAVLFHELLRPTGSLYVHMDSHLAHYVKVMLDEVFGNDNFVREIIWRIGWISGYKAKAYNWARNHDTILFYAKNQEKFTFNKIYIEHDASYRRASYGSEEAADIEVFDEESGERIASEGKPIDDVWLNLPSIQIMSFSGEKTGFPTQKNENLLERIVQASSNPGDLVADFFVGSGTTAVVAQRLGRRWIASDLSRFAIHTTRKRLLSMQGISPFVVQNLGKYERQLWQETEFGDQAEVRTSAYRRFILDLYHATPIEGYVWLHGNRGGTMVHVGTVDAPITVGDVKQIATEFRKAIGKGKDAPQAASVDVLGWDFAFEVNEVAKQEAALASIAMRFVRIPREVLDKRAVEQGDVRFFELAALDVALKVTHRVLKLTLRNFVIPVDDVPDDVQRSIKDWTQWIDYWAVDWNNGGDTFHNEWQSYRTRANQRLEAQAAHEYEEPGRYRIVVKVIDILGNDTTKSLEVEVL